jgi:hypothetical protein
LACLGELHFKLNDADDAGFEKLDMPLPTFISGCANGTEDPRSWNLWRWVEARERSHCGLPSTGFSPTLESAILEADSRVGDEMIQAEIAIYKEANTPKTSFGASA